MDWLGDTSGFVCRTECGHNGELAGWLGTAMIVGSILSACGYLLIIVVIHIARVTWLGDKTGWALYAILFEIVFFLCGMTHVCTALAFVWPAYRLFTLVECLNGFIGVMAAMSLLALVVIHSSATKMELMS